MNSSEQLHALQLSERVAALRGGRACLVWILRMCWYEQWAGARWCVAAVLFDCLWNVYGALLQKCASAPRTPSARPPHAPCTYTPLLQKRASAFCPRAQRTPQLCRS